jgi:hypothetical protein
MYRITLPLMLAVGVACQPATTEMTDEQRAAIRDTVEQIMDGLVDAGRAIACWPAVGV